MAADGGAAPPPGGRDFWDGLLKEEHEQAQAVALEAMGKVWAPCRKPLSFAASQSGSMRRPWCSLKHNNEPGTPFQNSSTA